MNRRSKKLPTADLALNTDRQSISVDCPPWQWSALVLEVDRELPLDGANHAFSGGHHTYTIPAPQDGSADLVLGPSVLYRTTLLRQPRKAVQPYYASTDRRARWNVPSCRPGSRCTGYYLDNDQKWHVTFCVHRDPTGRGRYVAIVSAGCLSVHGNTQSACIRGMARYHLDEGMHDAQGRLVARNERGQPVWTMFADQKPATDQGVP